MRLRLTALFFLLCFYSAAYGAKDYGVTLGFRSQSGTVDASNYSTKAAIGYQLGVTGTIEVTGSLGLRTGMSYIERPLKVEGDTSTLGSADYKMGYFDIPFFLSYKIADYFAFFGGVSLALNLTNSINGNGSLANIKMQNVKSLVLPLTIGTQFRFAPQTGAEVFFEMMTSDVAENQKSYKAVGVNLAYYFD